jgi:Icc-related predicted phosphoesterase
VYLRAECLHGSRDMRLKLLLFSDLHCDYGRAGELVRRSAGVDAVIGAGDFASVRRGLDETIAVLSLIDKPAILVPGNNETLDELRAACRGWKSATVLHGEAAAIDGVAFFGIGGGIPITPFGDWSYDFSEEAAERLLGNLQMGSVLVSHSPPKGLVDMDSRGASLGSTAVMAAIERTRPRLVVCGHIHGSAGMRSDHGETAVINAGPDGIEFELK